MLEKEEKEKQDANAIAFLWPEWRFQHSFIFFSSLMACSNYYTRTQIATYTYYEWKTDIAIATQLPFEFVCVCVWHAKAAVIIMIMINEIHSNISINEILLSFSFTRYFIVLRTISAFWPRYGHTSSLVYVIFFFPSCSLK